METFWVSTSQIVQASCICWQTDGLCFLGLWGSAHNKLLVKGSNHEKGLLCIGIVTAERSSQNKNKTKEESFDQSFCCCRTMLPLRKHAYSNIQKISPPKTEHFQIKNSDIFHISAQNVDCGYSLEPPWQGGSNEYPQSMFWAEIRKIMYTPVNPSFTV